MNKFLISVLIIISINNLSAQTINPTGDLNTPRWLHQSQVLYANSKVIAFGGDNCSYASPITYKSAELYDYNSGTWVYTGDMKEPRTRFTSNAYSFNVIAIGGSDDNHPYGKRSCEIYDYLSATWSYADSMQIARYEHSSIEFSGGILVAGGSTDNTVEIFQNGKWKFAGNLNIARYGGTSMVVLSDGRILITGGSAPNGLNTAEIYNPTTDSWTLLPTTMNENRSFHKSILLDNGKVLISGGYGYNSSNLTSCEIFDPATNTFTLTSSLSVNHGRMEVVRMNNGEIMTFGLGDFTNPSNTKCLEFYNIFTGTWNSSNYNFIGAQAYSLTTLPNGSKLISGGSVTTLNGALGKTFVVTNSTNCSIPSLTPSFTGNTVCIGKDGTITLNNSEAGVKYQAYKGSSLASQAVLSEGGTITIPVYANKILTGNNTFTLKASYIGCNYYSLNNTATIVGNQVVPKPDIIDSAYVCMGDSILIQGPSGYNKYYWSNGMIKKDIYISNLFYNLSVKVEDNNGCQSDYSDPVGFKFLSNKLPTVSISITSGNNPVIVNNSLTFTAKATDGGVDPIFQWFKNGIKTGTNSNIYTYTPNDRFDTITCRMITKYLCPLQDTVNSNSILVIIKHPPSISSFSSKAGAIDSVITIKGLDFKEVSNFKFYNNKPSYFQIQSDSVIKAKVPPGAVTGKFIIESPWGKDTSDTDYLVLYNVPFIKNISPSSGPVGTKVKIYGRNFGQQISDNTVYFGAAKANILEASDSLLTVSIPAGANHGTLTVTAKKLVAQFSRPFVITFPSTGIQNNSFGNPVSLSSGNSPAMTVIKDIDGDDKTDIITINNGSGDIYVYRNNYSSGPITSASFDSPIILQTSKSPSGLTVEDINGDGKPELIVVGGNKFWVFKNESTSGNMHFSTKEFFGISDGYKIATTDIDQDGKIDVLINPLNQTNGVGGFMIFRNISTDTINFIQGGYVNSGTEASNIFSSDLNNDYRSDVLLCTNHSSKPTELYPNRNTIGETDFYTRIDKYISESSDFTSHACVLDLNQDGRMDYIAPSYIYTNRQINIYQNNSTPDTLIENSFIFSTTFTSYNGRAYAIADYDGDSKVDIFNGTTIFKNNLKGFSMLNTQTSFQSVPVSSLSYNEVTAGDLNGDGKPEIIGLNISANTIDILENLTVSDFVPQISTAAISNTAVCAGSTQNIAFNSSGFFYPGNSYKVEFSFDNENFNNPVVIGTGTASPISVVIPTNLSPGAYYRIRVISTSPEVIGTENSIKIANPSQPIIISGPTNTCSDYSTYTIANKPGYSYTWKTTGGSIVSQNNNNCVVKWDNPGVYSLNIKSDFGCIEQSSLSVNVKTKLNTPSQISIPPYHCLYESRKYSVFSDLNASSYTWTFPEGWILSGSSNEVNVKSTNLSISGIISVKSNNECGSSEVQTHVISSPIDQPKPDIYQIDDSLTTSFENQQYRWIFNNTLLSSNKKIKPVKSGDYTLVMTDPVTGCSDTSDVYKISLTSIQDGSIDLPIQIYPNPASDKLTILIDFDVNELKNVYIKDLTGKIIGNYKSNGQNFVIDISDIAKGVYLLEINNSNQTFSRKLVIQ